MRTFPQIDVAASCQQFGPDLAVSPDLNGAAVMLGIAAVESGGGDVKFAGRNCGPRQEPAYSAGGSLAHGTQAALNSEYGDAIAAASHGPWQMLFGNFSTETQIAIAAGTVVLPDYAREFVRFFNSYVVRVRRARTLEEMGSVWNLGHIGPDPAYTGKLTKAYEQALTEIQG